MAKRKASRKTRKSSKSRRNGAATPEKLPKNAVILAVMLKSREGQEILLEAELRALLGPTRKEEGCLRYDLHRAADGAGTFFLHEIWETRDHHTAHTKTDHFLRWNARKDALLASRETGFWKQVN